MKTYIHIAIVLGSITFFHIQTMEPSTQEELNNALFDTINTGQQGNTIFNVATDIMRLVREGANPNAKNYYGETPLSAFVSLWTKLLQGKAEESHEVKQAEGVILFFIAQKVNINSTRASGITPLMDAVRNDSLWAVKTLVEEGADILAKDTDGKTALDMARKKMEARKQEMIKTYYQGQEPSWWQVWRQAPPIDEDIIYPIYTYLRNKQLETGWQEVESD